MSLLHRSSWTGYLLVVLIWNCGVMVTFTVAPLCIFTLVIRDLFTVLPQMELIYYDYVQYHPLRRMQHSWETKQHRALYCLKGGRYWRLCNYIAQTSVSTKTNMSPAVVWCYVLNIQSMMTMRLNLCPPPRNQKVNHIPDCTLFQVGLDFTFCYCYIVQHARAVWLRSYPFKKRMFSAGISCQFERSDSTLSDAI